MNILPIELLIFFWGIGPSNSFQLIQFCTNAGAQYAAVVIAASAGNFSEISPKVLFEPVRGIGLCVQYISTAKTVVERRERTLAVLSLVSASCTTAVTTDPATNLAVGGAVAAQIAHMRAIFLRGGGSGGSSEVVGVFQKTPVFEIYPPRRQFIVIDNSKMIIDNIFQDHTARRYLRGSTQKLKTVAPTCLAPITSTQISVSGWIVFGTVCGMVLIGGIFLGGLCIFQYAERNRYQNKNDKVLTDRT